MAYGSVYAVGCVSVCLCDVRVLWIKAKWIKLVFSVKLPQRSATLSKMWVPILPLRWDAGLRKFSALCTPRSAVSAVAELLSVTV